MNYSIIIPAYNAQKTLAACLQALQTQTVPREQYEIIVINDASQDNTVAIAEANGADRIISEGKLGKSGTRNAGAKAAQGAILLFTDADCEPLPNWIEEMVTPFLNDPEIIGAKGAYYSRQTEWVARFTQVEVEERYDLLATHKTINFIDTYSAGYRRDVFLENGGFDVTLPEVEDQDLSFRLAAKGYKMVFIPSARVYHHHLTSAWGYAKRKYRIAKWRAMLMHRHPERIASDSRTPQLLKVQMGFSLLLLPALVAPLIWQPFAWGLLAVCIGFVLSCIPFLLKTAVCDPPLLPFTLPMLLNRALALSIGYIQGTFSLAKMAREQTPILAGHHRFVKRLMDIVLGSLLLLMALPIILLVAPFIKLTSRGPIFFRQKRIGREGHTFTCYKLRSMELNAEARLQELVNVSNLHEPNLHIENDPRITPFGQFLRRWSLDELPQLWNVVKGDMSLIGPRPEEAWIVAQYTDWQRQRLSVKPGITGPMQVSGRKDLPFNERVTLELDYIQNYSLWRDIIILLKTLPAVLSGTGAR